MLQKSSMRKSYTSVLHPYMTIITVFMGICQVKISKFLILLHPHLSIGLQIASALNRERSSLLPNEIWKFSEGFLGKMYLKVCAFDINFPFDMELPTAVKLMY